jgi:cell division septal protein FtsQ
MRKPRGFLRRKRKVKSNVTAFNPSVASAVAPGTTVRGRSRKRGQKSPLARLARPASFLLAWTVRLAPYALVTVMTASLPYFGYKAYMEMMTSPHLALAEIEVRGATRLRRDVVIAASGLDAGDNVLTIDEGKVEEQLRWLPWVRTVDVERDLPDRVIVHVEERVPAAILVDDGAFLVDAEGYVFKEMSEDDYDVDLLVIAGVEAARMMKAGEARRLREILTEILAVARDYRALGLDRFSTLTEVHFDQLLGMSLVSSKRQRFALGVGEYPAKLRRLSTVLGHLDDNGSGVTKINLDNEKQPWKVAAAGTSIKFKQRRSPAALPAMGRELLP